MKKSLLHIIIISIGHGICPSLDLGGYFGMSQEMMM